MFITLLAKRTAKVTPSETDSTVFQRHYAAAGRQRSRLSAVLGRRGVSAASRETRELGGEAVGALVHLAVALEGEPSRTARSVNPNRGTNLVLTLGALSRRAVWGGGWAETGMRWVFVVVCRLPAWIRSRSFR